METKGRTKVIRSLNVEDINNKKIKDQDKMTKVQKVEDQNC